MGVVNLDEFDVRTGKIREIMTFLRKQMLFIV